MTKINSSPERHTFQKEGYIKRCEEEGKEPNPDYVNMFNTFREQDEANLVDPAWQKNNMEYDLRGSKELCNKVKESDNYAQNLYAAMCNMEWRRRDLWPEMKEENWGCSWRHAGGIVADMQQKGDYIDWYCSGIKNGHSDDVDFDSLTEDQKRIFKEEEVSVSELDEIVLKATANNPDKRFKDAGAMHEQVLALLTKLDPNRRQMSLELDIPIPKGKSPKKKRDKSSKFDIIKNITTQLDLKRGNEMRETSGTSKRKRKVSNRVKRNRAIALLIVLLIIGTSWYRISGPGNKIVVPSLAGMSQTQAASAVAELGLKVDVIQEVFSEDIPKGKVITSDPAGGGRVEIAGTVHLIISKGKDRIEVPDLVGLTVEEAAAALKKSDLKVGRVSEKYSDTFETGLLIDGIPTSGSPVRKDSTVDLIVSKGNSGNAADYWRETQVKPVLKLKINKCTTSIKYLTTFFYINTIF